MIPTNSMKVQGSGRLGLFLGAAFFVKQSVFSGYSQPSAAWKRALR
jgi:hypothetical protein